MAVSVVFLGRTSWLVARPVLPVGFCVCVPRSVARGRGVLQFCGRGPPRPFRCVLFVFVVVFSGVLCAPVGWARPLFRGNLWLDERAVCCVGAGCMRAKTKRC